MINKLRETIAAELENVRTEIDSDADQERATLEGWESALVWALNELDKAAA